MTAHRGDLVALVAERDGGTVITLAQVTTVAKGIITGYRTGDGVRHRIQPDEFTSKQLVSQDNIRVDDLLAEYTMLGSPTFGSINEVRKFLMPYIIWHGNTESLRTEGPSPTRESA